MSATSRGGRIISLEVPGSNLSYLEGWRWSALAAGKRGGSGLWFSGCDGPSGSGWCADRCPIPADGSQSSDAYLPCEIGVTIPCAELLPGNFVSALFSTSSLAVMRHSLAPSIHRDRGREFGYEVHRQ